MYYYDQDDKDAPHWINDRLREVEDLAVPYMKSRGESWLFIGNPRMRGVGVVDYAYIGVPTDNKKGKTKTPIGRYTIRELQRGVHLTKYLETYRPSGDARKRGPKVSENISDEARVLRESVYRRQMKWRERNPEEMEEKHREYYNNFYSRNAGRDTKAPRPRKHRKKKI